MTLAVIIALTLLGLLSVFQIALILGAPLGRFAWGGQHRLLPPKLRIGSVISIIIYAIFAIFTLNKASILSWISQGNVLNITLWIIFAYLVLGVFMNAVSRSKPERYTMTPVALILAICLFIIASS